MEFNSIMYNGSGCLDPTAGEALSRVMRQENLMQNNPGMNVYICSPRNAVSKEDILYLQHCCTFALKHGVLPVAPFLFFSGLCDMSNRKNRMRIIKSTHGWLNDASEIWVFDGEPDEDLKPDFAKAVSAGKTVRHFTTGPDSIFIHDRATRHGKPIDSEEDWYVW